MVCVTAFAASAAVEMPATLDDITREMRAKHSMKGLVIAVVTKDGVESIAAEGIRAEGAVDAITTADRMHLGSCTKAFTATLAATFVADGSLRWDSTVGEVLGSNCPSMHEQWKAVTLEELLRHRSGAPSAADPAAWKAAWECTATPSECRAAFTDAILAQPLAQPRGTQAYSNQGYAIAGRMCEAASTSHASYESLLTERVLAPLGIREFGFGVPSHAVAASPKGHASSGVVNDGDNPQAIAPAGTLHMTLGEWAKFVAFQLGAAAPKELEGAAKLRAYLHTPSDTPQREALGWFALDRPWGGRVLTHSGSNTLWYCVAWLAPEKGFAVLAATNQGGDAMAKACDEACAAMIRLQTERRADTQASRAEDELTRNDITWSTPSTDASGSMPIGDGALGANVWTEANGDLVLLLSHTDAFSEVERLLKLGRVRVRCEPPLDLSTFSQRMEFAQNAISIATGAGESAVTLRVSMDRASSALKVRVESAQPRSVTASLESWRTSERHLSGAELKSAWIVRDAPANLEVVESADVVMTALMAPSMPPNAVECYHRNEHSIVPFTLAHQGLTSLQESFRDPLLLRTFGARVSARDFARANDTSIRSVTPVTNADIVIHAACAQTTTVDEWRALLGAPRAHTQPTASERFASSWIFVEPSVASVIDNRHPLRIGFDSNAQNRFDGEIRVLRFTPSAAASEAIASITHAGIDAEVSGTVVARSSGSTWKLAHDLVKNGSFTIEGWIMVKHPQSTGRIADKLTAGRSDGFLFDLQGGKLRAIVGDVTVATNAAAPVGTLAHVALTYDAASTRVMVYLDGVVVGSSADRRGDRSTDARTTLSQALIAQRAVSLAASNGTFPTKFNGSIFTVAPKPINGSDLNEDFRNWGGDYWWQNTRLLYHGMLARGEGDRMKPLFDFYFNALEGCRARAKLYHGVDGAYFPETMTTFATYGNGDYGWDREGVAVNVVQCPYWQWAWNQGPELVALMLDHYDYTRDETVLRERTLPIALEVLAYFDSRFARDANGVLVITPTQSAETYWSGVVNDLPCVVGLREITSRLLALPPRIGDASERALWTRVARACPAMPLTDDGTRLSPAQTFDAARSNCENPELYAVWPFNAVGLGRGNLAIGRASYAARVERMTHGWTQDGMQAARLGLADEAAANVLAKLANSHRAFRYPTNWGPNFDWLPDQCHGSNLLTTVQEMLLQSVGEKILVLPAWPREWNARFRLHAGNRTTITAQVRDGALVALEVDPPNRRSDVELGEGWTMPASR